MIDRCTECDVVLADGARFCGRCGSEVATVPSPEARQLLEIGAITQDEFDRLHEIKSPAKEQASSSPIAGPRSQAGSSLAVGLGGCAGTVGIVVLIISLPFLCALVWLFSKF